MLKGGSHKDLKGRDIPIREMISELTSVGGGDEAGSKYKSHERSGGTREVPGDTDSHGRPRIDRNLAMPHGETPHADGGPGGIKHHGMPHHPNGPEKHPNPHKPHDIRGSRPGATQKISHDHLRTK